MECIQLNSQSINSLRNSAVYTSVLSTTIFLSPTVKWALNLGTFMYTCDTMDINSATTSWAMDLLGSLAVVAPIKGEPTGPHIIQGP